MKYSVLRYTPSLLSGEWINLGVLFCDEENNVHEFHHTNKWQRIKEFDDELDIDVVKRFLSSLKEEATGTLYNYSKFVLEDMIKNYVNEFNFDKPIQIAYENKDEMITSIKKMYLRFDFDKKHRLSKNEQLKFISNVIKTTGIEYRNNEALIGSYNDKIVYDYIVENYGIKMLPFKDRDLNRLFNFIKAWAWNSQENKGTIDTVFIYDYDSDVENVYDPQFESMIQILKSSSDYVFPISEGLDFIQKIPVKAKDYM